MYLKIKFSSRGYLTLRSWQTFPASTAWMCSCPTAGPIPHFLSFKKRWEWRRMRLFIKTGAAWIFQTGNMIPQCHSTQRRGLWMKSQIGIWPQGITCSHWKARKTRPLRWCRDRGLAKLYLTTSACISARPAIGSDSALKKQSEQAQACAHIVDCECGWRGWVSLWTYQAFQVCNKANWRWGINLGCAEWCLGNLDLEGGIERFRMLERCWHCARWKVEKD